MRILRLPFNDPRTIARDIPGISDLLFPQLVPTLIRHMNKQARVINNCTIVSQKKIDNMTTNAAMLFEVAYAKAEQMILFNNTITWDECFHIALKRQKKYFDAVIPEKISENDIDIANITSINLVESLKFIQNEQSNGELILSPVIPGYGWISSGIGDYSINTTLIEVKCSGKNFSSSDYRQVLMYWLLSYASSIENKGLEWESCVLLNPRLNKYIIFKFDDLLQVAAVDRSKIEILELFASLIFNSNE